LAVAGQFDGSDFVIEIVGSVTLSLDVPSGHLLVG
jgi:hypothetical protein